METPDRDTYFIGEEPPFETQPRDVWWGWAVEGVDLWVRNPNVESDEDGHWPSWDSVHDVTGRRLTPEDEEEDLERIEGLRELVWEFLTTDT